MIRLAKINFVFLMFVTAYSGVFASDNQGQDSQSKHIIHKEGVEVKSTTIYTGVPSRQEMEKQGMSIEEIKGADPSENGVQDSRNKPISNWSEKDYLKATSPVFHDAIRNPSVGTSRSYLPKVTITPGDETSVEQRTAPISTWGVQDYLKVVPQNKHQAIKEMQKELQVQLTEQVAKMQQAVQSGEMLEERYNLELENEPKPGLNLLQLQHVISTYQGFLG